MAFEGMNTDEVRGLAGQLDHQSSQINSVIGQIDSIIGQLESAWKGQDATTFAGWWRDQHRPHLLSAEQAINGLATSARNNASDQDSVSKH